MEKGRWADPMGLNPHSYGLFYSPMWMFSWRSQNTINTSNELSSVLFGRLIFIILPQVVLKLIKWNYTV